MFPRSVSAHGNSPILNGESTIRARDCALSINRLRRDVTSSTRHQAMVREEARNCLERDWRWLLRQQRVEQLKYSSTRCIKGRFLHSQRRKKMVSVSLSKCLWIRAGSRDDIAAVIVLMTYANAGQLT